MTVDIAESVTKSEKQDVWINGLASTLYFDASEHAPGATIHAQGPRSLPRLITKVRNRIRTVKDLIELVAGTLEWLRPDRHFPRDRQTVKPIRYRAYKAVRWSFLGLNLTALGLSLVLPQSFSSTRLCSTSTGSCSGRTR